ncbi:hypothetical protein HNP86_001823 [Methanococcus maripaludis]|uniref:Uncharacterized protein n=1 Tax=Methanococcus maripaludis TaxID=39152 RepID=A0A7J9NWM1_METMI|nr:hypothetical protein [Methanococcus maripaludis]MBA2851664.1 hypothetical protein [Methanococcus maripaludis]
MTLFIKLKKPFQKKTYGNKCVNVDVVKFKYGIPCSDACTISCVGINPTSGHIDSITSEWRSISDVECRACADGNARTLPATLSLPDETAGLVLFYRVMEHCLTISPILPGVINYIPNEIVLAGAMVALFKLNPACLTYAEFERMYPDSVGHFATYYHHCKSIDKKVSKDVCVYLLTQHLLKMFTIYNKAICTPTSTRKPKNRRFQAYPVEYVMDSPEYYDVIRIIAQNLGVNV